MLEHLLEDITPQIQLLERHPLYREINSLDHLRQFMQSHVYAVFDFMSLTKQLQAEFAPTTSPWMPPRSRDLARFINEIVLVEESDIGPDKTFMSHFEMYCSAMAEVQADQNPVRHFLELIQQSTITRAIEQAGIPASARRFIHTTFALIEEGKIHKIAASFCFGREKSIPKMFQALLDEMKIGPEQAPTFHYYLKRHIDVDGDDHGPFALKMLSSLCGADEIKWEEAETAALQAIAARIQFWDDLRAESSQWPG